MSPDELSTFRSDNKLPKGHLAASEAELLCRLLRQRLGGYSTSLEDDAQLLASVNGQQITDISQRRRLMAVLVRQGEKEILAQYIRALETYVSECPPERDNKRPSDAPTAGRTQKRRMA